MNGEGARRLDEVTINITLLLRNSLRYLCVLCVSAVVECARPIFYRRDAENAEAAQRIIKFHQVICLSKSSDAPE